MPFVPVLAITAVYLLIYRTTYFKRNIKRNHREVWFGLHFVLGVASAVLAARHFLFKLPFLPVIPLPLLLTGIAMLALFVVQIGVGVYMKKHPNARLFAIHRVIPLVLIGAAIVHAVILKAIYF